jgi:hypothetical protein
VIAVGFLALAALDELTAVAVLVVAGVVAVALVLVEVIARRQDRPVDGGPSDDTGPDQLSPERPAGVGGPPA